MVTLEEVICKSLLLNSYCSSRHPIFDSPRVEEYRYLEVPIRRYKKEIPVFVHNYISVRIRDPQLSSNFDKLCIPLKIPDRKSYYSTVPSMVKDALFPKTGGSWIRFEEPKTKIKYMGNVGILLKEDFEPVMITTVDISNEPCKITLRLNPKCLLETDNPVHRFIMNKYVGTAINIAKASQVPFEVTIGDFPFNIRGIAEPDINTTNRELLDTVIRNIDEVIQ